MRRAHALIIHYQFLIDAPHFHLPWQTAERSRRLGLDVLRQGDGGGAGVGCLADGGAEEEVAQAGEVGFLGGFARGCGGGGALRRGGFGVAGEDAGVAGPAVMVWSGGGAADRKSVV